MTLYATKMSVVRIIITRALAAVAIVSCSPHSETFRVLLTFLRAWVQCGNAVRAERHCHVPLLSNCFRHFYSTMANCEASHCGTYQHSHLINSVQSRSSWPLVRNFVSYVKKIIIWITIHVFLHIICSPPRICFWSALFSIWHLRSYYF